MNLNITEQHNGRELRGASIVVYNFRIFVVNVVFACLLESRIF